MRFQYQAKLVAWVDIISSAVVLFLLLLGSFIILTNPELVNNDARRCLAQFITGGVFTKILFLGPSICYLVAEIVLGIFLLKAAETLNYKKLRTWYVMTITMAIVIGIMSIREVVQVMLSSDILLLFLGCNFAFTIYSVWIVHRLRNEIKVNSLPGQHNSSQAPPVFQASLNSNYVFPPPATTVPASGGTKEPIEI